MAAALQRLPFVLPDFTRLAWTSEHARQVWEPRLKRISHAWSHVEWLSVAEGVRRGALSRLSAAQFRINTPLWRAHNVSALALAQESAGRCSYSASASAVTPSGPSVLCVGLAHYDDLAPLKAAWDARDDERLGQLFGYPACCRAFFRRTWVEGAHVDTTWEMARASATVIDGTRIEVAGPDLANILCRWIGVRAVPHLPCSFTCKATVSFAEALRAVGVSAGFAAEMDWVAEVLSWPVAWSALHGIAEVKTPIVKVSTRTDATSLRYDVQRRGSSYPPEGATGLRFPFRAAATARAAQPLVLHRTLKSWRYLDNGFASEAGMDRAHLPIVELAAQVLGGGGAVLDLGCGNAILLQRICERAGKGITPFGIDLRPDRIAHARKVLPEFAANFLVANIFEEPSLRLLQRPYRLVMVSVNRLLELPDDRAQRFSAEIRQWTQYLLVYRHPAADLKPGLDGLAKQFGWTVVAGAADAHLVKGSYGLI